MLFQVLGTLELDGAESTGLRARKPRILLSMLLLRANAWVSLDELVAAIWDGAPPASAERNVTTYVWQLRKALAAAAGPDAAAGGPRIDGRSGAYRIRVEPGELDRDVFEREARAGHDALLAGRPHDAVTHLRQAAELWRGRPFDGLDTEAARVELARLSEVHWDVRQRLAEALESCGRGAEAIALLTALTTEDPLRETPWCHLLKALARAGRPADALAAYQRARDRLIEELGVEPGAALRQVHRAILTGEESDTGEAAGAVREGAHVAETVAAPEARPGPALLSGPRPDPAIAAQRRLLTQLRIAPGPSFDVYAAAALADAELAAVETLLAAAVADGSLTELPGGRYAVAADTDGTASGSGPATRAAPDPVVERAATHRLAAYYAHVALAAAGTVGAEQLCDVAVGTPVPCFVDAASAARWLGTERDTLLSAACLFAGLGWAGPAWRIVRGLQAHVDAAGAPERWTPVLDTVAAAARLAGDAQGELVVRNALGIQHWRAGHHEAALSELGAALRVAETGAESRTVTTMLLNLAEAHESLERFGDAADLLDRADVLLYELRCPQLAAIADDCRVRLHHAAVQRASAGVLYRRWTHAVPPTGRLGA